jgi:hypothetical protein
MKPSWIQRYAWAFAFGAVALTSGCVNILQQNLAAAVQTAQSRAQFELDCPQVETSVLSQKTVEGIRWELAEYTIGARGCGRQAVYLTYCRDPEDCNAIAQSGRVQPAPFQQPGMLP